MRILVISRSAWRNDNNTGNTLTDFFCEMHNDEIFSLCMRAQPPQNNIAKRHFYISEAKMMKRMLGKKVEIGSEHIVSPNVGESIVSNDEGLEKEMYDALRKKISYLMYFVREAIWTFGGWRNENLKTYIEEIRPDVIFFPTFGCYYPHKILRYLHTLTDAKIVLFHADDHYTLKQWSLSPVYWIYRIGLRKWMRRTAKIADLQYCISEVQKSDYENAFRGECKVLTKAADFAEEPSVKVTNNKPLQLVFTGNLSVNRWKSLSVIVKVLERINEDGLKAQLRIYSSTPMTTAMSKSLNVADTSIFMGSVPASEIPRIQSDADVLVHVEAFDLKNRLAVRQSFSTKIVDYFKAARPILAVGPKNVASIKHLIDNNAAIVADSEQELYDKLVLLLSDKRQLTMYAKNAYMCGRQKHDKIQQQKMLKEDFTRLVSK